MTKIWVTLIANDSVAILTAVLKPMMSNIFHSTIEGKYIINRFNKKLPGSYVPLF